LRDRTVARVVRKLLALPGHEVFKFEDGEGNLLDVRRTHINAYIKEVMGDAFSAKDFRTWAGTLICACALRVAGSEAGESRHLRKKKIVLALRATADQLGNTPAICRSSYVHSLVLDAFEQGRVLSCAPIPSADLAAMHPKSLHPAERALLRFLRGSRPAARRSLRIASAPRGSTPPRRHGSARAARTS
jgi:DNA topoisomerase-1